MSGRRLRTSLAVATLGAVLSTGAAFGQSRPGGPQQAPVQEFALSTTVGWSDNIRGEYNDQESETIAGVGIETRVGRQHRRLSYDLSADLTYLDYLNDTFQSEVTGVASFDGRLQLVQDVLNFVVQDNFGQTQSSPFAPSTPETRQNVNVLSAGPDLRVELGDALVMLASGRFMLEQYETTPADNTRTQVQAGFYHEFSADSSLGVLAQKTAVDYDSSSTGFDFDRDEYLARYTLTARRTAILMEAGQSQFSADDGTEREITLYRVNLSREITPRTVLIVAAGKELSDTGSLFVSSTESLQPGGGGTNSGVTLADLGLGTVQGTGIVASTDSLAHRYLRGTWRLNAPRTRAYIGAEMREERYLQGVSQNRDVQTISAGFERNLNAAVRAGLDVSHNTRESQSEAITLKDMTYRLSAAWQATRRLEFTLSAERAQRVGSSTGGGFQDHRIWARMIWSPRGAVH